MAMSAKLLPNSIHLADDGKVVCEVQEGETKYPSVIEASFFEDMLGHTNITPSQKVRLAHDSSNYIERQATTQIRMGLPSVTVR